MASRLLGKSIDHGQAQAAALPHFLGRVERLKRLRFHCGGHSNPVVANRENDIIADRNFGILVHIGFVEAHIPAFDYQLSTIRHRVTRVKYEVQQGILDLAGIGLRLP